MTILPLTDLPWLTIIIASVFIVVGWISAWLLGQAFYRMCCKRTSTQQAKVLQRLAFYLIWFLFIVMALQQFGVKLGVLLGAAGVFSVAIGFAAKTAMSNLVSGVFLVIERPFRVGHHIQLNQVEGHVSAIDLLSTKITTFDQRLIRIPNETVLTATITNFTHYGQRRLDLTIAIAYGTNVANVKTLLLNIAHQHAQVLETPAPNVIFFNFTDAALQLRLSVWVAEPHFGTVKAELQEIINDTFVQEKIEIPYPQLTIHTHQSI